MSNFWRSFDFPLINCDIEFELSWSKHCIISAVLARQTNNIFQQINFTGKLDKDDDAAISFITDKQQKSFL